MKSALLRILIVCASTVITSCELSFQDNQTIAPKQTTCITVVDDSSNTPVDSAYVELTLRNIYEYYETIRGTTDVQGKCCFEHNPGSAYGLFVKKEGYVSLCTDKGLIPSPARLTPVGYLRLHVHNVLTTAEDDLIGITYPDATCNGSDLLLCQGINVDTTITFNSQPCNCSISWISWHNNVRTDSTLTIIITSHDTTFVQILY